MKFEQYNPTSEEMKKATKMMNAEQKAQSKIREKYKIQFGKDFHAEDGLQNDHTERRACSQQEREKLDASLEQLGDLFAGADFFWQLDGALNISLYCGDYIGIHKDVDISIDESEIEKIEAFLDRKGYGLFLASWDTEKERRTFERVDAHRFKERRGMQLMIVSINEAGKRRFDGEVSHIDTHLIRRDENGMRVSHEFTQLPEEWYEPRAVRFHERELHCSHPALVAYYKLFNLREYDVNDLKLLAQSGALSDHDVNQISEIFDQHMAKIDAVVDEYIDRVFDRIVAEADKEKVFAVLMSDELVYKRRNPEMEKLFREISDAFVQAPEKAKETLKELLLAESTTSDIKVKEEKDKKIAIMRDNLPQQK